MIAEIVLVAALAQQPATKETRLEENVIREVNTVRVSAGLGKLTVHPALTASSRALAKDLASRNALEHQDRRGWKLVARVEESGYRDWMNLGENIAFGQKDAVEAVQDWIKSPSHRKMIYEASFTETGVGVAVARDGTLYWVQQFGTR